jgi:hypothetical protein
MQTHFIRFQSMKVPRSLLEVNSQPSGFPRLRMAQWKLLDLSLRPFDLLLGKPNSFCLSIHNINILLDNNDSQVQFAVEMASHRDWRVCKFYPFCFSAPLTFSRRHSHHLLATRRRGLLIIPDTRLLVMKLLFPKTSKP